MANYSFDPRTPYNLIDPPIDLITHQNNEGVLQRLLTVHNLIIDQLKIAKAKQKHYDDHLSRPKPYNVGEKVMLNTPNLKLLNQSSKKFRSRYIGPYKIIEKISSQAYKLYFTLKYEGASCLSYRIGERKKERKKSLTNEGM